MSVFQCEECGCAENTALGWYWCKDSDICPIEILGRALCSACAPTKFRSGDDIEKFNGKWHNIFERTFLPKGSCFTNHEGNIQDKKSKLVGNKLYAVMGSKEEYQ